MHEGSAHITHEAKAAALEDFFSKQLGTKRMRQHMLNWGLLKPVQCDLQDLDNDISKEEIHEAVKQTASEKAPGPGRLYRRFLKVF
jgi:hypothetical protein